jgi:hypothetical protein
VEMSGRDRRPSDVPAFMAANREQSNQGFDIDREATVGSANRRFFLHDRHLISTSKVAHCNTLCKVEASPDGVPPLIARDDALDLSSFLRYQCDYFLRRRWIGWVEG